MKTKIQIKSFINNDIIFEFEKENNTIKDTLEEAVKQNVSLYGAELNDADLNEANLSGADLRYAHLSRANLCFANLRRANLSKSTFYGANLFGANLCNTNLDNVIFDWANISMTQFNGAQNMPHIQFNCPSEGSFIGWKKVEDKLVKLEIPEDANRSSGSSRKCRCDKAKVLTITDLDGSNPIDEILNTSQEHEVLYKVGEMVYPDSFDENRWNECSHGIHFLTDKQEAINY